MQDHGIIENLERTIEKYENLKCAKEKMMNAVCNNFKGLFKNEINLLDIMLHDLKTIKNNMEV